MEGVSAVGVVGVGAAVHAVSAAAYASGVVVLGVQAKSSERGGWRHGIIGSAGPADPTGEAALGVTRRGFCAALAGLVTVGSRRRRYWPVVVRELNERNG